MNSKLAPTNPPPPLEMLGIRLIISSGLLIFLGTQAPFDFTPNHYSFQEATQEFFRYSSNLFDVVGNVVVFLPYGVGWAIQGRRWGWGYLPAVLLAAGVSMLFSTLVETLQLFLPVRCSSAIDICTNTAGGLFGGLAYGLWCKWRLRKH